MVVAYVGGAWTDQLEVKDYGLDFKDNELTLSLDVAPRGGRAADAGRDAFRDFIERCSRVETIQIARRGLAREVRERARMAENADISVKLKARGKQVVYPAALVFGPDMMTITLG
jgi:hypothetical protein